MLSPSSQHPMLRSFRTLLPRLFSVVAALALGACGGGDNPLEPATRRPVPPRKRSFPTTSQPLRTSPWRLRGSGFCSAHPARVATTSSSWIPRGTTSSA